MDDFILEFAKHVEHSANPHQNPVENLIPFVIEHLNSKERSFLSQLAIVGPGFNKELVVELTKRETEDDEKHLQSYLDTFTVLRLLTYDEEHSYYRMQSTVQQFALKDLGETLEARQELARIFTTSTPWFSNLASAGVDRYLLSVMVFDEHKATIRNVLEYLRNHPTAVGDRLLLDFFELIYLFGYSRLATNLELIPLLHAMVASAIRLRDKDKLDALLGYLSEKYQRLQDQEHASEYTKLRENITQQANFEVIAEYFRNSGSLKPWNLDSQEHVTSDLLPPALEEFTAKKTKIILTGFMGTGKTTVGKLLADHLNYRFIDTDELIESRNDRSISDIFQELGEDAFREMERGIVREIAELDGVVISTGGRLMLDPVNVNALSHNSRVLCLVATPDEILTRVLDDHGRERPLLSVPNPKQRIVDLLQERNDKYRRFPQIITDEKKPTDIARGLVEFINTSPKSLTVENPQMSYEYVVGAGLLPFLRQLAGLDGEVVIITDEGVHGLYGPSCSAIGNIIEIPSGRQHKSLATVQAIYDELLNKGFDRSGTIISLGGSVVGDVAGYVAATYMRGVNFVQCPTSLIAMVDTSVGGKTSIDLPQGKNMIGVYKQPAKVIADVATLQTLHQADFASGMAEVIKHGLIAESNLLEQVEQGHWAKNWDRSPSYIGELQRLVAQAIQVKINIVQVDPFELGQRSILNLGHTFAYAIEQVSNNAYRHGEAVAIGLVAATNLSTRLGYCDTVFQKRIEDLLESVNLPTRIPANIKPDALLQAMQRDKKKRAGQIRFILLRGIGQAFVSDEVPNSEVLATISAITVS
jgi:3-dehydroquinate synthase